MPSSENRIQKHPIVEIERGEKLTFFWEGKPLIGYANETIASALIANGIHIFQYHHKDHSPQGIFCANGQCSQCMLLVDGRPVKSCTAQLKAGMRIQPLDGLYQLPEESIDIVSAPILKKKVKVLIIGAGPSGLSCAAELGEKGIDTLLIDDKQKLGGKLILQTHRFFGSKDMVYAGTRGIEIAKILSEQVNQQGSIEIWANSPAIGVFSDHQVALLKDNRQYALIEPEVLIIATGAREKNLRFPGNTLPGIMGAGAFQTLLNRDWVLPGKRYFVVGGGNVGLIAAYHALQAGIEIAGLIEIMPRCGGYKVHLDKIKRLGVPIKTSHTILAANGQEHVGSVTIAQVDEHLQPIIQTKETIPCDGVLIATGLSPVDEFFHQAKDFGYRVFSAGDAQEIAEASAAIVSGKITAKQVLAELGVQELAKDEIQALMNIKDVLSARPGEIHDAQQSPIKSGVKPVFHCEQEIPCDPCSGLCIHDLIKIPPDAIQSIPSFVDPQGKCIGCSQCVIGCPGLAVTLVDYRKDPRNPFVHIPYEFTIEPATVIGNTFPVVDKEGKVIGNAKVIQIRATKKMDHTTLVIVQAPAPIAELIAGIRLDHDESELLSLSSSEETQETIICRCERVTEGEIRDLIRAGIYDLNLIKAITRAGMGACGGKTCESLILQIMKEEGVSKDDVRLFTKRPPNIEIPMHTLLSNEQEGKKGAADE